MDSTAFSFFNSNSEVDGSQEIELTIGSLNILIGPSGSSRLSDPTKSDPSASNPKTKEIPESSEGSSSEVNLPVSLEEVSITGGDEIKEIFELEDKACQSSKNDLAIGNNGVSKVHQLYVISLKRKETIAKEVKTSTGKSIRRKTATKRRRRKSMSLLANGE
jgi:hypothetical protein